MNTMVNLDVLVVYSAGIALSASVDDSISKHPFLLDSKRSNYNLSYDYFLQSCKRLGLSAGLTTSADIIGPGMCKNYWTARNGNWSKIDAHARSTTIFDKISPVSLLRLTERQLLLSNESISPFNDPELHAIFFDKLQTYAHLTEYAIPTISIASSSLRDVTVAIARLRTLIASQRYGIDFSKKIVLKDRFGAGGNDVYKINDDFINQIRITMMEHPDIQFVLQPFLKFDKGFSYKTNRTSTDLRLIFHHNTLLQCYIRMAKGTDFRCNEHQGGQLVYVSSSDIPDLIHAISQKIVSKINKPQSLYALDFVISNNGHIYFIEGNIGPGIDWDITKKKNEMKSKQLIRSIVSELASRVHNSLINPLMNTEFTLLQQPVL